MNPNIDFLGICQLLKALRAVGFSENEIKKIARRIAVELGANFTNIVVVCVAAEGVRIWQKSRPAETLRWNSSASL